VSPFVLLLATALFINYVDRGVLPTAAQLMQVDLQLSDSQLGILMSAFFWTYALVQIPVGWLAERIGADRVLAGGLVIWAAATMLMGIASIFPMLIALRLLLGIGESTGFPCVSKLLAAAVPVESLGTANGIVGCGYLVGPAVGTYLGGMLMATYGWRSAFLLFGALSLLWLLPWLRVLKRQRLVRAQARAASIGARKAAAAGGQPAGPSFLRLLGCRALWGTSLGLFSCNYAFYFMLFWLPSYLVRERGFSTVEMAQLAGSAYVVMALCALGAGWAIDRHIRRGGSAGLAYKSIMVAAHGGALLCMLAMAFGSRPLALGAIFLFQALIGASSPGCYAIPQILGGAECAGRWVGIQNSVGNLAGVAAPALTGFIVDATKHFTIAFVVAGIISLLGIVGWIAMLPKLAPMDWSERHSLARAVAEQ
jgi:MFS family permease